MKQQNHRFFILLLALGLGLPGMRAQEPAAAVRYRNETPAQHDACMQWWRDANFGMFIHWGVYAQLGGNYKGKDSLGVAEWIMRNLPIPKAEYEAIAKQFNPVMYDWKTCMTMNENWGYRASDHKWKSTGRLVQMLIEIVSKGGNFLLNIGPKGDGSFPDEAVERLKGMGEWMKVNGEAIYGVEKSPFATLPFSERTGRCAWKPAAAGKPDTIYLYLYSMPDKGLITLPINNPISKAYFLAKPDTALKVEGKTITVPGPLPDPVATVVALEIAGEPEVIKETTPAKGGK
ncbi:MAG: alpha-L-fucosidase [Verrucomicrobia bacterium]|nr:alpha-L-fucosidase [Verrucomicrobiota bacterium]